MTAHRYFLELCMKSGVNKGKEGDKAGILLKNFDFRTKREKVSKMCFGDIFWDMMVGGNMEHHLNMMPSERILIWDYIGIE